MKCIIFKLFLIFNDFEFYYAYILYSCAKERVYSNVVAMNYNSTLLARPFAYCAKCRRVKTVEPSCALAHCSLCNDWGSPGNTGEKRIVKKETSHSALSADDPVQTPSLTGTFHLPFTLKFVHSM